ncbi:MAG: DUF4124 domain-containing protein [Proteobacteria bacterium]|nr:DUF4124 domain-containing protein [Pseudomonadota bacterium]
MCRIVGIPCLVAATLLGSDAAVADINKWIDPDGRVNYGDHPPLGADITSVLIRSNVIETDRIRLRTVIAEPSGPRESPADQDATETRMDIRSYVEHCWKNRGVDCELEARQMIDGPAPLVFPGDPAVFPRPDLKPPPPGLPLKFSITP